MREISILKDRILQYLEFKGVKKSEFYQVTGVSNGVLSQKNGLSEENILRFLNFYSDINPTWLLTGVGEMISNNTTNESSSFMLNEPTPVYDLTATAGIVGIFGDSTDQVPIDHIHIPNLPKCDGAMRVTGDSMYPLLKSGDLVLYRHLNDKRNIIWGEMYLMYINDQGDEFFFVKYVQKSKKEGYVKLVSQNQHHEAVEFPIDSIKQMAIVKASVRINSQV